MLAVRLHKGIPPEFIRFSDSDSDFLCVALH